ncbi:MAG: ATP-binding protein [Candidatus Eremiobacteraeota bacterium]|nr:ATP-binding protein [Candidatus Eremiobacteraeota bacterium]
MKNIALTDIADPGTIVENPCSFLDREFPRWPQIRDMTMKKFREKKGYHPKQLHQVMLYVLAAARKGETQIPLAYLKRFIENNYAGGSERDLPCLMKAFNDSAASLFKLEQADFPAIRRHGAYWILSDALCRILSSETAASGQNAQGPPGEPMQPPPWNNPYGNRKMIKDPSQFYGRKELLNRAFSRLGGARPQCLSIIGERRIGKSSLLWNLQHPEVYSRYLPEPGLTIFVFMDLQENTAQTVDEFFEIFFLSLQRVRSESTAHESGGYPAFKDLAEHLENSRERLIILLDEFERVSMNPNFDPEFFFFLRAMANRYEIAFITSSARDLQQLCSSKEIEASPFFNIFTPLQLSVFRSNEASEFIESSSRSAPVSLAPWTRQILDLGGFHPMFLQIACSAAVEASERRKSSQINWHKARTIFLEEAGPHFLHFWEHLGEEEQSVVKLVAHRADLAPEHRQILRDLRKRGIAYEYEGSIVFYSPLFTEFVVSSGE